MKLRIEWKTCFRIGVSAFLLYLCISYWDNVADFIQLMLGAAMPLLIGCAIAYLVNILMRWYEQRYFPRSKKKFWTKTRRPVCMIAAYATLLVVIALIVVLIVPQLWSCIEVIIASASDVAVKLIAFINERELLPEDIMNTLSDIDWQSKLGQIVQMLTSGLGNVVEILFAAVSSVFSGVITAFLSIIFSVYLLVSKEKLGRQYHKLCKRYLKESWYQRLDHIRRVVDDCFHKYIVGQCLEALILGALCALGMLILRLPYAAMIGALVAFTALIPVAGAYIGAAVGAFMILTVSPVKALIFLVFLIVLQQVEGNIIYPKVVGSSMGLPGIWVLAAVTVGGGVLGVPGMLLGVPLAAAIYRLVQEDVRKHAPAPLEAEPEEADPPETQ